MTEFPDVAHLSHAEKDALIRALWAQVQALTARVAESEAKLGQPPKNSDNSSQPPSRDKKPNREGKAKSLTGNGIATNVVQSTNPSHALLGG